VVVLPYVPPYFHHFYDLLKYRLRAKQSTARPSSLQEGFNVDGYPVSGHLMGKEVVSLQGSEQSSGTYPGNIVFIICPGVLVIHFEDSIVTGIKTEDVGLVQRDPLQRIQGKKISKCGK